MKISVYPQTALCALLLMTAFEGSAAELHRDTAVPIIIEKAVDLQPPLTAQPGPLQWESGFGPRFTPSELPQRVQAGPFSLPLHRPLLLDAPGEQPGTVYREIIKEASFGTRTPWPIHAYPLAEPNIKADHLVFLHTFNPGRGIDDWRLAAKVNKLRYLLPPEYPTVIYYDVVYEDGVIESIPVRWREGIESWYRVGHVGPMLWAPNHWMRPLADGTGEQLALYAMEWPNPRPEVAIRSIRARTNNQPHLHYGEALVFSVTALQTKPTGRTYYVKKHPYGSDDNDGSYEAPWATVPHAWARIGRGDTLFIHGGKYDIPEPVIFEQDGDETGWITVSAFPGETPILDGSTSVLIPPQEERDQMKGLIRGIFASYWRIQGLQVQNSRRAAITFNWDKFDPATKDEVSGNRDTHVDVLFNRTFRTYAMGILVHQCNHVRVIGNTVVRPHSNEMRYTFGYDDGEMETQWRCVQEGIDLSWNDDFQINWNEVYGAGKEAIDVINSENGEIKYNYVHHAGNGIYIDPYIKYDQKNIEIAYNRVCNTTGGLICGGDGNGTLEGVRIHHNLVYDGIGHGLSHTATTKHGGSDYHRDIISYNNTVDNTGWWWDEVGWSGGGCFFSGPLEKGRGIIGLEIVNNLFTDNAHYPIATEYTDWQERNIVVRNNMVTRHAMTAPEDERLLVAGDNLIQADPLYMDPAQGDYRLRPGSPAIGRAVEVGGAQGPMKDLGAIPFGYAWIPGLDYTGRVLTDYVGRCDYRPVDIPDACYNLKWDFFSRNGWFDHGIYGPDIRRFPGGHNALAGVVWKTRNYDDLMDATAIGFRAKGSHAWKTSESIPVGRSAFTLNFLHSFHLKEAPGEAPLFSYFVNYADGTRTEIPIRLGAEIGAYTRRDLTPPSGARIAWHIMDDYRYLRFHTVYAYEWANPKPEIEVVSIDIVSSPDDEDNPYGSPIIFAMTTGHAPPSGNRPHRIE